MKSKQISVVMALAVAASGLAGCRQAKRDVRHAVAPGLPKGSLANLPPRPAKGDGWNRKTDVELIRLLVVVAWSDDKVDGKEADRIWELSRAVDKELSIEANIGAGLTSFDLADTPNLAPLRPHAERVVWEIQRLHLADGEEVQAESSTRLSVSQALRDG